MSARIFALLLAGLLGIYCIQASNSTETPNEEHTQIVFNLIHNVDSAVYVLAKETLSSARNVFENVVKDLTEIFDTNTVVLDKVNDIITFTNRKRNTVTLMSARNLFDNILTDLSEIAETNIAVEETIDELNTFTNNTGCINDKDDIYPTIHIFDEYLFELLGRYMINENATNVQHIVNESFLNNGIVALEEEYQDNYAKFKSKFNLLIDETFTSLQQSDQTSREEANFINWYMRYERVTNEQEENTVFSEFFHLF